MLTNLLKIIYLGVSQKMVENNWMRMKLVCVRVFVSERDREILTDREPDATACDSSVMSADT
jgi:hypothetical protein